MTWGVGGDDQTEKKEVIKQRFYKRAHIRHSQLFFVFSSYYKSIEQNGNKGWVPPHNYASLDVFPFKIKLIPSEEWGFDLQSTTRVQPCLHWFLHLSISLRHDTKLKSLNDQSYRTQWVSHSLRGQLGVNIKD